MHGSETATIITNSFTNLKVENAFTLKSVKIINLNTEKKCQWSKLNSLVFSAKNRYLHQYYQFWS